MRKILVLGLLLIGSTFSFAESSVSGLAQVECIDLKTAFLEPCEKGQEHFFVQGQCKKTDEVESFYCAIKGEPECIDRRAAFIEPCEDEKEMVFVQGQCGKSYEFEHVYCR